jgi:hypothetical protein
MLWNIGEIEEWKYDKYRANLLEKVCSSREITTRYPLIFSFCMLKFKVLGSHSPCMGREKLPVTRGTS